MRKKETNRNAPDGSLCESRLSRTWVEEEKAVFRSGGITIRALSEKDIPEMQMLFRNTVLHVNRKDYTKEETEDWASCGDDPAHWADLLSAHDFIAAWADSGEMIGFASMNAHGHLHSMFVHQAWQGRGVATLLLAEAEAKARDYGVRTITADVSITARPFFERRGYQVIKQQQQRANRLLLTNFSMRKDL